MLAHREEIPDRNSTIANSGVLILLTTERKEGEGIECTPDQTANREGMKRDKGTRTLIGHQRILPKKVLNHPTAEATRSS